MDLKKFKSQLKLPLRQASLVFLVRDRQVLLAMKKRGFGKDWWNGVGGKVSPGETIDQAARRETKEELEVDVEQLKHVATLDFYFPTQPIDKDWNQQVVVFICQKWSGEISETEEMRPKWFSMGNLPLDQMWPDDQYWLPLVLKNQFVEAEFAFGDNNSVLAKIVVAKPLTGRD